MGRMKKLIEQLVKFGLVGVVAFVIDWGILNVLVAAFHMNNVLAGTISFLISLAFNYWASMKYVFKHRDDMARWMEGLVFLLSAVIGLGINDWIIWLSTLGMAPGAGHGMYVLRTNIGKLVATVVVAVWNFIIRKWLLDNKETQSLPGADSASAVNAGMDAGVSANQSGHKAFAKRLGEWSIAHTPKGWQ